MRVDLPNATDIQNFLIAHNLELLSLFNPDVLNAQKFRVHKRNTPLSHDFEIPMEDCSNDVIFQCAIFRELIRISNRFDELLKGENDA